MLIVAIGVSVFARGGEAAGGWHSAVRLHSAFRESSAGRRGTTEIVRLRGGAVYVAEWEASYRQGKPSLFAACRVGDLPVVSAALDKMRLEGTAEVAINAVDQDSGRTALHWAAAAGREQIVRLLLDRGADASQADRESGWLPLHSAASAGHLEVVKELLRAAGTESVNVPTRDDCDMTPLHLACSKNHTAIVRLFLEQPETLTDVRDGTGATPIWRAGSLGALDIVDMLLARGAEMDSCDYHGNTTLHVRHARPKLAHARGAYLGCCGCQVACTGRDEELIIALIERGADPLRENLAGAAPVDALDLEAAKSVARHVQALKAARGEGGRSEAEQARVEEEVSARLLAQPSEPLEVLHHCCGGEGSPDHDPSMCTHVFG
jgi:ankyrin repeat protein